MMVTLLLLNMQSIGMLEVDPLWQHSKNMLQISQIQSSQQESAQAFSTYFKLEQSISMELDSYQTL